PSCLAQMSSFLGMTSFYLQILPKYSLTQAQRKYSMGESEALACMYFYGRQIRIGLQAAAPLPMVSEAVGRYF
ncbi:hypothetical protein GOODEAATRI_016069, partial [Goodea atripinnis]